MILGRLVTYLTAPCPGYVRRMGYLSEIVNIRERHRRCRDAWAPHLQNTRKVVAEAAEECPAKGRAVVLGSGLLLDLPLDTLARRFDEVVLADILHLPYARRQASRHRNIRLVECDVTGLAYPLFEASRNGSAGLPSSIPFIPGIDDRTALVVSLNILSQLTVMPSRFARRKVRDLDEAALTSWCDRVRSAHYSALKSLPCDVCLIADYRRLWRDAKGGVVEEGSTVGSLELPAPDVSWTWEIAPLGEASRNASKELLVGAWRMGAARQAEDAG